MYQAIPFLFLRPEVGYGIFSTPPLEPFDIGAEQPGVWRMETRGGELDYYIIYGPDPPRFSAPTPSLLVGCRCRRAGRLHHQCRWSESETVAELARIPCDVIHLILTIRLPCSQCQALPEPQLSDWRGMALRL